MTQYALCMGVSDYSQWRTAGWQVSDLPYSIKNAEDFAQILINAFGFDPANIGIQRDSWCSYGNIVNVIDELLVHKVQPGDVVCIFFSGHGTRLQGVTADYQPDSGLWYEAIVPHTGNLFTDYDMAALAEHLDYSRVNLTF